MLFWLCLYAVLGLVMLFFPLRFFHRTRHCTEEISGKVVGLEEIRRHRGGSLFRMQISYQWEGQQYYGTTWGKYRYDACAARDTITIWVDPQKPDSFEAAGEKQYARRELWFSVAVLVLLALYFALDITRQRR